MDSELQSRLLRVLEEKKLRRVGAEFDIDIDVRILSATNRPPEEAVEEGLLREDLYFRLAQFPLQLPPLRERGGDVQGLAQYFLNELNRRHDTDLQFTAAALEKIDRCSWPGNVRQLKHAVEKAYILSETDIDAGALQDESLSPPESGGAGRAVHVAPGTTLAETERHVILAALKRHGGNRKATASELGISLKTLYNRLKRYGGNGPPAG
jgi:transcriptional regulator with PAS, ATPase and Fis domain